jgi:hypothetical protein
MARHDWEFHGNLVQETHSFNKPPNATVHPPGPLQRRGVARNKNAAPVVV